MNADRRLRAASAPRVAVLCMHSSPLARLGVRKAGGMNVYVRELSGELARRGARVDIFTRRVAPDEPAVVETSEGARVINLPAGDGLPCDNDNDELLAYVPEFVAEVRRFAARYGASYDVMHSHYWLSGVAASELRREWDVPLVHMFHTLGAMKNRVARDAAWGVSPARLRAEAELLRTADRIIAATPRDENQMRAFLRAGETAGATTRETGGCDVAAPIEVIPCGVDARRFRPHDKAGSRSRLGLPRAPAGLLLFVGRIEPLKGLDTLLHALDLLRARGGDQATPELVVVGGAGQAAADCWGDEERRLRALVCELKLSERVTFAGARPHDELPFYYSAADLLVAPSHYESFGMSALEAQACGTPVVASRVGGLAYTIDDGITGCLAPWHDRAAFADRISRLLAEPEARRSMGEAARARALRYDWSQIAARVLDLYRDVGERYACSAGASPARRVLACGAV